MSNTVRLIRASLLVAAVVIGTGAPARAQTTATNQPAANAGDALSYLLLSSNNKAAPVDEVGVAQGIVSFVNQQISTFPVATSWAGVSLRLMPDGTVERIPASLGPLFAERPYPLGRGHWSFGATLQPVRWESIDGINLKTDGIVFEQQNANSLATWQSKISLTSTTLVVGANVGLTKRIDFGVSVPYLRVHVSGTSTRETTGTLSGNVRLDRGPNTTDGTSEGLGDISLRSKINLVNSITGGWAVSGEWRLPTGSSGRLLGTGAQQWRATLVGAGTVGMVSPHVNVGYVWAGPGISVARPDQPANKTGPVLHGPFPNTYLKPDLYIQLGADFTVKPSDEFTYNGGFDIRLNDRVTVDTDFIGRVVRNSATLENLPFQYPVAAPGPPPYLSASQPFLVLGTRNLLFGVTGVKIGFGTTVLTAHVLFPGSRSGLVPAPTLLLGIEQAVFRQPSSCGC
jgi:hypothetical protein